MRRLCTLLCGALLVAACAAGSHRAPTQPGAATRPLDDWREANTEVAAAMRRVSAQLLKVGAEPGELELAGFMPAGVRQTYPFVVPASRCATVVVLTSRGLRDVDAALYTPEGELLAADAQPDAHPTIQVCAGEQARPLYLILHAYDGAGSFLAVAFIGRAQSLAMAARLLGTQPAVARLEGDERMADRVSVFAEGVRKRGFEPEGAPLRIPIRSAQRIRVSLDVQAGACYTAAGFALEGVDDMNLRVFDDEGKVVAQDLAATSDAATQFCSSRNAQYATEAHAAHGSGLVLLVIYRAGGVAAGGSRGLWLGERAEAFPNPLPLEAALQRDIELGREAGFGTAREQRVGRLLPGEAVAHQIELPAGRCSRIVATPGRGIVRLSLAFASEDGTLPLPQTVLEPKRMVHLCTNEARSLEAQVVAEAGAGRYALTSLAKRFESGAAEGPEAHRLQAEGASIEEGFHADHAWNARAGLMQMDALDRATKLPLRLLPGTCARVYVYGEGGGVRAQLVRGSRVLHTAVANGAPLRTCAAEKATKATELTVELQATSGLPRVQAWLFRK